MYIYIYTLNWYVFLGFQLTLNTVSLARWQSQHPQSWAQRKAQVDAAFSAGFSEHHPSGPRWHTHPAELRRLGKHAGIFMESDGIGLVVMKFSHACLSL